MIIQILLWILVVILYIIAIASIANALIVAFSLRKDVPFVPLKRETLNKALELLEIEAGDEFIDIGSGDGRVVFSAVKYPASSYTGVEMNRLLVAASRVRQFLFQKDPKINFIRANAFNTDYSRYNKVYLYMLTEFNRQLMPKLKKELPDGAVVVSAHFSFGDEFIKQNEVEEVKVGKYKIYIWKK